MSVGNTKYGDGPLQKNINGSNNSAFGICSSRDTDVSWNTSVGAYANMSNISGISNVAVGTNSRLLDVSGSYNTALGTATLLNNKVDYNTAVGSNSMEKNIYGKENVAVGVQTGYENITGEKNVFIGCYAGFNNVDGSENIYLGYNSGFNITNNSSKNTFLGAKTGIANTSSQYMNSTAIGYGSIIDASNQIMLGTIDNNVNLPGNLDIGGNVFMNDKLDISGAITQKINMDLSISNTLKKTSFYIYGNDTDGINTPIVEMIDDVSYSGIKQGRGFCFFPNSTSNAINSIIEKNDSSITSRNPNNNNALTLSNYGGPKNGIRIFSSTSTNGSVKIQSGNNSIITNATSNISMTGDISFNSKVDVLGTLNVLNTDAFINSVKIGRGNSNLASNTVVGKDSGYNMTNFGIQNTFIGYETGYADLSGSNNSFFGYYAGRNNTTGNSNTFIGKESGASNLIGNNNSFLGDGSGFEAKGNNNVLIGYNTDAPGNINNSVAIGSGVKVDTSNTIVIGSSSQTTQIPGNVNLNQPLTMSSTSAVNRQITSSYYNVSDINGNTGRSSRMYQDGINLLISNDATSGKTKFINSTAGGVPTTTFELDTSNSTLYVPLNINSNLDVSGTLNANGAFNVPNNDMFVRDMRFGYGGGNQPRNTSIGNNNGNANTTGNDNTFVGSNCGNANTTGGSNVFVGSFAGRINSGGSNNTFVGRDTGNFNVSGSRNVFIGREAGYRCLGNDNVSIGNESDCSGNINNSIAIGSGVKVDVSNTIIIGLSTQSTRIPGALNVPNNDAFIRSLRIGFGGGNRVNNTVLGDNCGLNNTSGDFNLFVGSNAGLANTTGSRNVILGSYAGRYNTNGGYNTFVGQDAGNSNVSGQRNTYIGQKAGLISLGNDNVSIGNESDCSGNVNNSIAIGSGVKVDVSDTIIIGLSSQSTRIPGTLIVSGTSSFENPITLSSTTVNNRRVYSSYYNLTDANGNVNRTSEIFQNSQILTITNEATSGRTRFINSTSGNVPTTTFEVDATNSTSYVPLNITANNNLQMNAGTGRINQSATANDTSTTNNLKKTVISYNNSGNTSAQPVLEIFESSGRGAYFVPNTESGNYGPNVATNDFAIVSRHFAMQTTALCFATGTSLRNHLRLFARTDLSNCSVILQNGAGNIANTSEFRMDYNFNATPQNTISFNNPINFNPTNNDAINSNRRRLNGLGTLSFTDICGNNTTTGSTTSAIWTDSSLVSGFKGMYYDCGINDGFHIFSTRNSSGVVSTPIQFSSSSVNLNSSVNVNQPLTMSSTSAANRQITSSYYNVSDINGNTGRSSRMYQDGINLLISNDATSGKTKFINSTAGGVPTTTFEIDTNSATMHEPLSLTSNLDVAGTLNVPNNDAFIRGVRIGAGPGTGTLRNIVMGDNCGTNNTSGAFNVLMGSNCGSANTIGQKNTFVGAYSGIFNTSGSFNTFLGQDAGNSNVGGFRNTYIGREAGLRALGNDNICIGDQSDCSGNVNNSIAIGSGVKVDVSNTIVLGLSTQSTRVPGTLNVPNNDMYVRGIRIGFGGGNKPTNTVIGNNNGSANTTGYNNTFIGANCGNANIDGRDNVFVGCFAGTSNTSGRQNTFIGVDAGNKTTSGERNTHIGRQAGYYNIGNNNICIGDFADASGNISNSIAIGVDVKATASNTIVLGTSSQSVQIPGNVSLNTNNNLIFTSGFGSIQQSVVVGELSTKNSFRLSEFSFNSNSVTGTATKFDFYDSFNDRGLGIIPNAGSGVFGSTSRLNDCVLLSRSPLNGSAITIANWNDNMRNGLRVFTTDVSNCGLTLQCGQNHTSDWTELRMEYTRTGGVNTTTTTFNNVINFNPATETPKAITGARRRLEGLGTLSFTDICGNNTTNGSITSAIWTDSSSGSGIRGMYYDCGINDGFHIFSTRNSSGVVSTPIQFSSSSVNLNSSVNVNQPLIMSSTNASNRQITSSYYNVSDINGNVNRTSEIIQNNQIFTLTNKSTSGITKFINSTASGFPTTTFELDTSNSTLYVPLNIDSNLDVSGTLNVPNKDIFVRSIRIGYGNNNNATNTVVGSNTGALITTGIHNVFVGIQSGQLTTNGGSNAFFGAYAGRNNISGTNNTFIGRDAGYLSTGSSNTFIGRQAGYFNTGSENICIGDFADASGNISNSIAIGKDVKVDTSNTIVIGTSLQKIQIPGNMNLNQPLTMSSTIAANRQMTSSYYNVSDICGNIMRKSQILHEERALNIINDASDGTINFFIDSSMDVRSNPLQLSDAVINFNKPIIISANNNLTMNAGTGVINQATIQNESFPPSNFFKKSIFVLNHNVSGVTASDKPIVEMYEVNSGKGVYILPNAIGGAFGPNITNGDCAFVSRPPSGSTALNFSTGSNSNRNHMRLSATDLSNNEIAIINGAGGDFLSTNVSEFRMSYNSLDTPKNTISFNNPINFNPTNRGSISSIRRQLTGLGTLSFTDISGNSTNGSTTSLIYTDSSLVSGFKGMYYDCGINDGFHIFSTRNSSGVVSTPIQFSSSSVNLNSSVNVNQPLTMSSTSAANRQITSSYYNVSNINGNAGQSSRMYQDGINLLISNDATSGKTKFINSTAGGVPTTTFEIDTDTATMYEPLSLTSNLTVAGTLNANGPFNVPNNDMYVRGIRIGYGGGNIPTNTVIGNINGTNNTTGNNNTFVGSNCGNANIDGRDNVFVGSFSGKNNTSGKQNTFVGMDAGNRTTDGSRNTHLGRQAGYFNTGSENICIGDFADASGNISNSMAIGVDVKATTSNTIVLGASTQTTQIAGAVVLGSNSNLTMSSGTGVISQPTTTGDLSTKNLFKLSQFSFNSNNVNGSSTAFDFYDAFNGKGLFLIPNSDNGIFGSTNRRNDCCLTSRNPENTNAITISNWNTNMRNGLRVFTTDISNCGLTLQCGQNSTSDWTQFAMNYNRDTLTTTTTFNNVINFNPATGTGLPNAISSARRRLEGLGTLSFTDISGNNTTTGSVVSRIWTDSSLVNSLNGMYYDCGINGGFHQFLARDSGGNVSTPIYYGSNITSVSNTFIVRNATTPSNRLDFSVDTAPSALLRMRSTTAGTNASINITCDTVGDDGVITSLSNCLISPSRFEMRRPVQFNYSTQPFNASHLGFITGPTAMTTGSSIASSASQRNFGSFTMGFAGTYSIKVLIALLGGANHTLTECRWCLDGTSATFPFISPPTKYTPSITGLVGASLSSTYTSYMNINLDITTTTFNQIIYVNYVLNYSGGSTTTLDATYSYTRIG